MISDLLLDTCGKCEDYTTKIIYSNKSDDSNGLINFPVSKTSYGQSEYSKFVPVITVPGVLVITRKSDLSKVLTQVASGSALSSWPIAVVTVVMATLAGIIIWFLVGIRKLLKNYFRTTAGPHKGVVMGSYAPKNGGRRTPLLLKNLSLAYFNEPLNNTVCVIFYVDNNSNSNFVKIKPITNKSSRYLHRPMFILRSQTGYTLYPF